MCCETGSCCGDSYASQGGHADSCCHSAPFPGLVSKKKKVRILEQQLEALKEQEREIEELLSELGGES